MPTISKNAKYTSPDIQNDIVECMANMVTEIVSDIKSNDAGGFTIKCDGTRTKIILKMSLVVPYVSGGAVKERLIELTQLVQLDAEYISDVILQRLSVVGLDTNDIINQCYDGASVMSGIFGSVQAKIQEKVGKEIPYVHCFNQFIPNRHL